MPLVGKMRSRKGQAMATTPTTYRPMQRGGKMTPIPRAPQMRIKQRLNAAPRAIDRSATPSNNHNTHALIGNGLIIAGVISAVIGALLLGAALTRNYYKSKLQHLSGHHKYQDELSQNPTLWSRFKLAATVGFNVVTFPFRALYEGFEKLFGLEEDLNRYEAIGRDNFDSIRANNFDCSPEDNNISVKEILIERREDRKLPMIEDTRSWVEEESTSRTASPSR